MACVDEGRSTDLLDTHAFLSRPNKAIVDIRLAPGPKLPPGELFSVFGAASNQCCSLSSRIPCKRGVIRTTGSTYVTYRNAARAGPSHGRRQLAQNYTSRGKPVGACVHAGKHAERENRPTSSTTGKG